MAKLTRAYLVGILLVSCHHAWGQFDILDFDPTAQGPWSDIENTTVTVPQVANGSISLDGKPGNAEYGGFEGVTVNPGENAWILDFPGDRQWDGPDDSSFTFWLAHDDDFFYVGVDVKDDVVVSDDSNDQFWKDDAIEIVTDVWNDNYDNNTDSSMDAYGGHSYANFEGRFSRWDDELEEIQGTTWSTAIDDWTYGDTPEDDISGFGEATDTGWTMEMRFRKRLFEDPDAEIELVEGATMGFNIGLDDDDKFGPGAEGDGTRSQDLEIQYFWANRQRFFNWNELEDDGFFTDEQIADSFERLGNDDFDLGELGFLDVGINSTGRLSHGGAGEIVFGGLASVVGDCNGDGVVDAGDLQCACASGDLAAVLEATGFLAGDLDGSGDVGFPDFLVLSANFGTEVDGYTDGDIDCNGSVEFADFLALSASFGQASGAAAAVPEPSSLLMTVLCLGAWSAVRRKRLNSRRSP